VYVWEIAHGTNPFMGRMLCVETCAGIVDCQGWRALGEMLDAGLRTEGQVVSRVECLDNSRLPGDFYAGVNATHGTPKPQLPPAPQP
jgi:hypothetical protein